MPARFGGPVPFSDRVKYLKDTFFYVTEEGYRQAQPLTGSGSLIVPTAAEVSGDFTGDFGTSANTATPVTGNPGGKGNTYLYDPTSPFVNGGKRSSLVLVGMQEWKSYCQCHSGELFQSDWKLDCG